MLAQPLMAKSELSQLISIVGQYQKSREGVILIKSWYVAAADELDVLLWVTVWMTKFGVPGAGSMWNGAKALLRSYVIGVSVADKLVVTDVAGDNVST